jgi:hypothetical protein
MISVSVVDVAAQARELYGAEVYAGIMRDLHGIAAPEHDYRFEWDTPTGGKVTFHENATAEHVALYVGREVPNA